MTEYWKQCEGQVIADTFPLREYLGGEGDHAVFLTDYGSPEPRKAAIKIVLGKEQEIKKQLHRWSAVSKLSHRHLLAIFSMGRSQLGDDSLAYLVMEYAEESLAQVIPVRPLTIDETRQMLEPAISALGYIHGQGFVHGRLKPGNMMATGDCLKISSNGLRPIGENAPVTPDIYSPPEIRPSRAGDVWSLGMTMVEAMTQRLPARDPAGANDPILPGMLPPPILEIAQSCLRINPKARATIADIDARLQPPKRPVLKWPYALAASSGLVIAAVVISPRFLNQQSGATQPAVVQQAPSPPSRADTKTPGTADEIVRRVLPDVPSKASRTIQGRVKVSVRVRVNPSGSVAEAELNARGPSNYFAQLALHAARRWKFTPANRSRAWILLFEFSRTGTHVVPVPAGP